MLVVVLLMNDCGKKQEARHGATQPMIPIKVKTAVVSSKERQAYEYVVGTIRSKTYSVIEAKVSGKIENLYVSPGQYVKKGEVLAKLDVREIQAKYEHAKAIYEQATSDLRRYKKLLDAEAATESEYEAQELNSKWRKRD
jgi:multidrug efflux pump subunit AcrA (membrane-fusion protein)